MKEKLLVYEINNFSLNNDDLMLNETVFHNANGYIGIRGNLEEGYPAGYDTIRGSYINGFYNISEMKQAEKLYGMAEEKQTMVNVADTQSILLQLGEETFSMFQGTVLESKRLLDMEHGFTSRVIKWRSPKGKEAEIIIKRMTSFYQLSLFTIEYSVKALNFSGDIRFISGHKGNVLNYSNPGDPRVAGESFVHILPEKMAIENQTSYITSRTSKSGLYICTGVTNLLSKEGTSTDTSPCTNADTNAYKSAGTNANISTDTCIGTCTMKKEEESIDAVIDSAIQMGEIVTLTKYTVFADTIRYADCKAGAEGEMKKALSLSLNELYDRQRIYLNSYWKNSFVRIDGDDELSLAVNYNLYQLMQSVGKDEHCNIAAKGLSGEGYEGHYFWDTEMYILPYFILTNPDIARNLLEYRYKILDLARENAKLLGHKKGALYPWRTIMGKECSGYFPSGSAQYHINGDIAYAVTSYYLATKDMDFIAEKGGEIIFETARLWMDAGCFYKDQFRINEVTGPDEYTCLVNNNYYTNASAKYNLEWAVKFYHLLIKEEKLAPIVDKIGIREEEIKEFEKAADQMYLPYDEELKINPQDDSFLEKKVWDFAHTPKENYPLLLHYHPMYLYRHQVCKQADTVLAHFIFEDFQPVEIIRKSYEYYEKITTHDSSLSACIFSIMASKLGYVDKAYDYFGDSAMLDLYNTHQNSKDGIHTANMGGNYMAIVYGFGGLRLKEKGLYFAPKLPKEWKGYEFKIIYEGSHMEVKVTKENIIFTLLKGEAKNIYVNDKPYELKDAIVLVMADV